MYGRVLFILTTKSRRLILLFYITLLFYYPISLYLQIRYIRHCVHRIHNDIHLYNHLFANIVLLETYYYT
uniref:Uncharacterized protein n=1 Tax=virus sp. ctiha2 TaxID=2827299 RepID=A0A8S5RHV5_9VIRU|nr:MAG TPA: hypothetical protein [virus sp. ctiha2]